MQNDAALHFQVEQFYYQEARLLDNRQYQQWLALVCEDIRYEMPSRVNSLVDNRQRGNESMISIESELETEAGMGCPIREERYLHLMVRVERAYKVNSWAENPPPRTRRIIGNIEIGLDDNNTEACSTKNSSNDKENVDRKNEITAISNFHLNYSRPNSRNFLYSGQRRDILRKEQNSFKIARREVIVDYSTIDLPTLGLIF